ncbi:hypothetical protein Dimus_001317 [Dionaea muscipula]
MPAWDFGEYSPNVYRLDDVLVNWHNTYALLEFAIELSCVVAYGPAGRETCELIRRVIESFSSAPTYNLFACLPPISIHGWNAGFSDHSILAIEIECRELNLDDFPTLFESTPTVVEVSSSPFPILPPGGDKRDIKGFARIQDRVE